MNQAAAAPAVLAEQAAGGGMPIEGSGSEGGANVPQCSPGRLRFPHPEFLAICKFLNRQGKLLYADDTKTLTGYAFYE